MLTVQHYGATRNREKQLPGGNELALTLALVPKNSKSPSELNGGSSPKNPGYL